ncbi:MAG: hypothetical protein H0W64_03620 [Gammaproteobacteria bacterium]|nr:hypothetical protein [Gammaproteobacteria bacterium]
MLKRGSSISPAQPSIGGGSTLFMMRDFIYRQFIAKQGLSFGLQNASTDFSSLIDTNLDRMVKTDKVAAVINEKIEVATPVTEMKDALQSAKINIDKLSSIGDETTSGFLHRYTSLTLEVRKLEQERSILKEEKNKFFIQKNQIFHEAGTALLAGRPEEEIKKILYKLNNPLRVLEDKVSKLIRNEDAQMPLVETLRHQVAGRIDILISTKQVTAAELQQLSGIRQGN